MSLYPKGIILIGISQQAVWLLCQTACFIYFR